MDHLFAHFASVFMGFFAIMNPVANTPVFLGLTVDDSPELRRKVASRALLAAFVIIFVFCTGGKFIFELFGITLPAFRITGGLLVFLIGYHMLHGENSRIHQPSEQDAQKSLDAELEIAITPLALPIFAGPGTIATAMNYASTGGLAEFFITIGAFLALCLITYAFFISGERIVRYLGTNDIKVITRIMGLILAVIGTQMFIAGIEGAVSAYRAG
jgi:multiple antibiotic resistance protein